MAIKRDGTVWVTGRPVGDWDDITSEPFSSFAEVPALNYYPVDVSDNLFADYAGGWSGGNQTRGFDYSGLYITDISQNSFSCSVAFYRLEGFDFVGTIDSKDHATLYDVVQNVKGELFLDGDQITLVLEDVPNHYFDMSLSEFLGGTQFVFRREW